MALEEEEEGDGSEAEDEKLALERNHRQKVNPDNVFDDLPEPYRTINKAIEDVLEEVAQGIDKIEEQRRSATFEYDLLKASPTSFLLVAGCVTCSHAEVRGSSRLALGFSHGEVVLADTRTREVVKSTRPFENGEAVKCIAMVSDGVYHQPPAIPGQMQERLKPTAKLLVSSNVKPSVLVYDICRDSMVHGTTLQPFCAINVPAPEEPAADADAEAARNPPSPIEQLHARGTLGAIWVVVLLFDRTIRTYLCPLGVPANAPEDKQDVRSSTMLDTIADDQEADFDIPEDAKDFGKVMQISTPKYCISLPSMVPLPGVPEPALDSLLLSVCTLRPQGVALSTGAGQVPTYCFLASRESNLLFCYSLRGPAPAVGAENVAAALEPDQEVSMEALLQQVAPKPGALQEPAEALSLRQHRRWLLPAKTSAMAVSPDGGMFAVGGFQGSLAVINPAAGASLQAMLSGHYDTVTSLAFHRNDVLISVGADSWIHIFSVRSATLLARFLASKPPSAPPPPLSRPLAPPPAVAVTASLAFPMALTLDTCGGIRFLDLVRCRKMAGAEWCLQRDPQSGKVITKSKIAEKPMDGYPPAGASPTQALATVGGFTILCYEEPKTSPAASPPAPSPDPAAAAEPTPGPDAEAAKEIPAVAPPEPVGNSYLVFFDYAATLSSLFPGIAARISLGAPVAALFQELTPQEMAVLPAEGLSLDQSATLRPAQVTGTGTHSGSRRASKLSSTRGSLMGTGASAAVARLTTENLQKLDKRPSRMSTKEALQPSNAEGSPRHGGGSKQHPHSGAQAIPENWQVGVKRYLRNTMADKGLRQGKIFKYIDAIRKELEG